MQCSESVCGLGVFAKEILEHTTFIHRLLVWRSQGLGTLACLACQTCATADICAAPIRLQHLFYNSIHQALMG